MVRQIKLSASITRHYGKVSATFGAELSVDIDEKLSAKQEYYKLISLLHHQFDEYEANQLPREPLSPEGFSADPTGAIIAGAAGAEWFTAVSLRKDIVKGKAHYAIVTDEAAFKQHGAPCYPEFLEEYHLVEYLGDRLELLFEPGTKVLVDKTGKYKKCIKLHRSVKSDG